MAVPQLPAPNSCGPVITAKMSSEYCVGTLVLILGSLLAEPRWKKPEYFSPTGGVPADETGMIDETLYCSRHARGGSLYIHRLRRFRLFRIQWDLNADAFPYSEDVHQRGAHKYCGRAEGCPGTTPDCRSRRADKPRTDNRAGNVENRGYQSTSMQRAGGQQLPGAGGEHLRGRNHPGCSGKDSDCDYGIRR